jgi:hypothetical protein
MKTNINNALKKIEASKQAIKEAEWILADLLKADIEVPSVVEEEPSSEPSDIVDRVNEVMEVTDKTPPRQDLECPLCQNKVFDNRPQKRSGEYKETSPDFVCSNRDTCSGIKQGQYGVLRKSWWLNSKDLPQDWIRTVVPPAKAEDTVALDDPEEDSKEDSRDLPF